GPEVDGARRERAGLQQPKAGRTLEVREEWRAPAEDHRMDDEGVLVHEAAADEAGGERRPADLDVAAEVPPELLENRLRIAAREAPAGRCLLHGARHDDLRFRVPDPG